MKMIIPILMLPLLFAIARAELVTKSVIYEDNGATLEGYLAYDNAIAGKRPGVLVIHEWTGINDYVKGRVEQLAGLGYVAFAADIYGKGIRPKNAEEAAQQAGIYRKDRQLMRRRVTAGLEELRNNELVDTSRIAAIGYCFGGGTVLELARSGVRINGVVSFHGNLDTPNVDDAKNIKCKVLVMQGADDPHTKDQVPAFEDEMRKGGVDWEMNIYGGAVHSFTNPSAGNDPSKGAAYNAEADHRSWEAMKQFFAEIFK
ncbi:Dienelactone hydrolase-like enzyme [Candidatus Zixiibacteriota bacterium]|nr:Dienelactone hydrolase-like enzyme [candidate division Zixibacteria bacterium]